MMALTLVGMQGVINRNEPRIYLDWIENERKNASRFWLSLLRQHISVEYLDLDGLAAINFLFQRYGSRFTGAVVYEPAVPDTINLATITLTATTPSRVEPENSRLIFVGWSGDVTSMDTSTTVRVDGPKMAVANWKTQYYLKVISERGDPQGEDWYYAGTEATFSVVSPLGSIMRDVFDAWTGDFSGKAAAGTITMDSPKSVVANWRKDYTILLFILGAAGVVSAGVAWALSKKRIRIS